MGFTTHIYKCNKCNKEFIYTSRQSHPTSYHKCKIKPVKQMEKKDFKHLKKRKLLLLAEIACLQEKNS